MEPDARRMTPRSIELFINPAAGGVGPGAETQARRLLDELGVCAHVRAPEPEDLEVELRRAVDAAPDLLMILAGDGTARKAAELCGPDGPVVAPLPGGTMNLLPHAVFGKVGWPEALVKAAAGGETRVIGGGEVAGHTFLVAAILGSPALWATARESIRKGRMREALQRAQVAWRRAFSGRVRYLLDSGVRGKAEAVGFVCPMMTPELGDEEQALEANILDPDGAAEIFRLAFSAAAGGWRRDPAVISTAVRRARLWASHSIPAVLDGEPVRLESAVEVVWRPRVARLLTPDPSPP